MGYGVVAIPKIWWYKGDYQRRLNYFRLKAVQLDEKKIETNYELNQCILKAIAFEKMSENDEGLSKYVKLIINRCPEEELESNRNRGYNLPSAEELNYKNLVNLNSKIKGYKSERIRLEW